MLTHASILLVTSNPTRTSPVKRGQFILDNILGTPAPPPPPDIPALEDVEEEFKGQEPTGRELMALAPRQAAVQLVPFPDGPAGPGAGELQRAGDLAREGARPADRCVRAIAHAASRSTTSAT